MNVKSDRIPIGCFLICLVSALEGDKAPESIPSDLAELARWLSWQRWADEHASIEGGYPVKKSG